MAVFEVVSGRTLTVNSIISQTNSGSRLTIDGGGTVMFRASNTFSGGVTVKGSSTLNITNDNQLGTLPAAPTAGYLVLDSSTTVVFTGGTTTLNAKRGIAIGPSSGTGSVTFLSTSTEAVINGNITNNGAGVGSLMTLSNHVTLGGNNSFTGGLNISNDWLSFSSPNNLGALPASTFAASIVMPQPSGSTRFNYTGTGSATLEATRGILIGPGTGTGSNSYAFEVTSSTGTLTIAGVIGNNAAGTGGVTKSGDGTLFLTGNNTFTGNVRSSLGSLVLAAAQAYTGSTAVGIGSIELDFTASTAPVSNIVNPVSALILGANDGQSSRLTITGKSSTTNSQGFSSVNTSTGNNIISVNAGAGGTVNLNLGSNIGRSLSSVIRLDPPSSGLVSSAYGSANSLIADTGAAFMTWGTGDWAAKNAANTGVVGGASVGGFYTPSTTTSLSGNANVATGVDTSLAADTSVGSLRFNLAEGRTITVASGKTLTVGGILVTPAVGAQTSTITGGSLKGSGTQDLVVFQYNTLAPLNIGSALTTGVFTKAGAGKVILSSTLNTYSGATWVIEGILEAGVNGAFSQSSTYNMLPGTTLRLNGRDVTVAGITGRDRGSPTPETAIENGAATPAILTVGSNDTGSFYHSMIQDGGAGSLKLVKTGTGRLDLAHTDPNTYTGGTLIAGGVLSVNNAGNAGTGPVTVGINAFQATTTPTLAGSGSATGPVTITGYGKLAPGGGGTNPTSVFSFDVTGASLTFQPHSYFGMVIGSTGNSDKVTVSGSSSVLNLAGGATGTLLVLDDLAAFNRANSSTYTIASLSGGATLQLNGSTVSDGTELGRHIVNGADTGSILIDTALFASLQNGDTFVLRRSAANLILDYIPVPEPSTVLGLAFLGLAAGRLVRRRAYPKHHAPVGSRRSACPTG